MKTNLLITALLLSIFTRAQIPAGYYNTATGTGYTLKTQLYNKIKGHTNKGYAGLWTTYATSDRDNQYENDNTIFDYYSENPTGTDPVIFAYSTNQCGTYTTEGNCYNREHIVPQSIFEVLMIFLQGCVHTTSLLLLVFLILILSIFLQQYD